MTDFTGKHGLIVGVANKRSIAWAIAQAVARRGARLALTYQGRFEEHVNDLSQGLEQPSLVLPCDVSSDAEIASVFEKVEQEFGALDFIVGGRGRRDGDGHPQGFGDHAVGPLDYHQMLADL